MCEHILTIVPVWTCEMHENESTHNYFSFHLQIRNFIRLWAKELPLKLHRRFGVTITDVRKSKIIADWEIKFLKFTPILIWNWLDAAWKGIFLPFKSFYKVPLELINRDHFSHLISFHFICVNACTQSASQFIYMKCIWCRCYVVVFCCIELYINWTGRNRTGLWINIMSYKLYEMRKWHFLWKWILQKMKWNAKHSTQHSFNSKCLSFMWRLPTHANANFNEFNAKCDFAFFCSLTHTLLVELSSLVCVRGCFCYWITVNKSYFCPLGSVVSIVITRWDSRV